MLIRKNIFREYNITTCENFMRLKIIKFESFLTKGITKENIRNSTRSEFMCHMNIGDIDKTTKNMKIFFKIKTFKRSIKRKKRSRKMIYEMDCS